MLHPVLYRHIYKEAIPKFKHFAVEVWHIGTEGKRDEELVLAGVEALADFIKEIGLPMTLTEMGITDTTILKAVAESSNLTVGCCKKLGREELLQILQECL